MIRRILDFALHQRAVVLSATLLLVLVGVWSLRRLPIEAYPDVADTNVQIITQWPGHAAEEIERQISMPIERVMNGVPHQIDLRSISIAGLSVVTLVFEEGTDTVFARQLVNERVTQLSLPEGAEATLGPLASPVGEIMRYRLVNCAESDAAECTAEDRVADPRSLMELKDLQTWSIARELLATPGVADVVEFGGTTKQFQVLVDPHRLASQRLDLSDVQRALEDANANAGGGILPFGEAALNVRGLGLLQPDHIREVPIAVRDGTPVRVAQVGDVQVGHRVRLGRVSVADEDDVVAALVLLRKGEHAQEVLDRVHTTLARVNEEVLPRGVKVSPYLDRTELMHRTISTVEDNLTMGITLVVVVLLFFLGNLRAALIVSVTIPLALLFAAICMDARHIPANLLSIGALDFGMVVDGSIVVVENVFRQISERRERGETISIRTVVHEATHEVARPIVFAKLIVIVAYLPIFTLQHVEGRLFAPMAWTVAFALIGATLVQLMVVPVLCTLLLQKRLRERSNPVLRALGRVQRPMLAALMRRRLLLILICAALAVGDILLVRSLGSEFLPHLNEGALWVRATLPANVGLAKAEALLDGARTEGGEAVGIREIIASYPEVELVAVHLGRPDDGTDPTGFYNAEILVKLTEHHRWRAQFHGRVEQLVDAMSRDLSVVPGVSFGFSQPISDNVEEAVSGVKGQIAVKILGEDLGPLDDLAGQISRAIADVPGVVDLGVLREMGQSNANIRIRRERIARYGLSIADVEDVIEAGIGGRVVGVIVEGERRHDLLLRFRATSREDIVALRRLPVALPTGATIPLSEVAEIAVQDGAARIYRENNRRFIAVKFGVRDRDLGSTIAEAQKRVHEAVELPAGYHVSWEGEFESARRAGRRLATVIPATIVAVVVLLFAMFRGPRQPTMILANVLLTSPLGGLAALAVTGTNFSVSAGVGFLALFGVSVQTGVILVSYIDDLRRHGVPLEEAVIRGAELRLRAIVMTALVATLGLLPAAMSTGIGSDSQKPLAIVVVGGLISSLVLSMVLLPIFYRWWPGGTGSRETDE